MIVCVWRLRKKKCALCYKGYTLCKEIQCAKQKSIYWEVDMYFDWGCDLVIFGGFKWMKREVDLSFNASGTLHTQGT